MAPVIIRTRHVLTCKLSYLLHGDRERERRERKGERGEGGGESGVIILNALP